MEKPNGFRVVFLGPGSLMAGGGGLWRSMWKKKPQESSDAKVKGSQAAARFEAGWVGAGR